MVGGLVMFVINSIMLGFGLAMDAFSVCIANGLNEAGMERNRKYKIAGVFGMFQAIMPLLGWICVRTIADLFTGFQKLIPWIALILLLYIGGRMIIEEVICSRRSVESCEEEVTITSGRQLFVQGLATSIDALSVGFTIAEYGILEAASSALIIGVVTFIICMVGLKIGEKAGKHLAGKASVIGGIILIGIGIEIFVSNVFL